MQESEADKRNMRRIIIMAKLDNGKKLTATEIEFLKCRADITTTINGASRKQASAR
jgi:hypothetical protein